MEPEPLQQVDRTCVRFHGRKLAYFAGCDYYRLASHPGVVQALQDGVKAYGLNVAASRMTTGNHRLYGKLEERLRGFFGAPSALLLPSGYVADLVVGQALAGNFSHALLDERAHPALRDASRFLDCPVLQFRHRDPDHLAATVRRCGRHTRPILLTDGMFAHDGSVAPLKRYLEVLPRDGMVLVDDAHGAGVLGRNGWGTPEQEGVPRKRVIQVVTLSKALGAYGGAVLGSPGLRRRILGCSAMFVGSTPLPLPLANASMKSLQILESHPDLRRRLEANSAYVKGPLARAGLPDVETPGPIVRIVPRHRRAEARLRAALLEAGIYPPFIRYPGGPASGYFRFVISSQHTREQLDRLLEVLVRETCRRPRSGSARK